MNEVMLREDILDEISNERERQNYLSFEGRTNEDADKTNTKADWIRFLTFNVGKAGDYHDVPPENFRKCMIKVAALALAATEAFDKGWVVK